MKSIEAWIMRQISIMYRLAQCPNPSYNLTLIAIMQCLAQCPPHTGLWSRGYGYAYAMVMQCLAQCPQSPALKFGL